MQYTILAKYKKCWNTKNNMEILHSNKESWEKKGLPHILKNTCSNWIILMLNKKSVYVLLFVLNEIKRNFLSLLLSITYGSEGVFFVYDRLFISMPYIWNRAYSLYYTHFSYTLYIIIPIINATLQVVLSS